MKIDEFKQVFQGELDKELLPLGFKYVKSRHGYILKTGNWHFHFMVDCVKWSTSVGITTNIYVSNPLADDTFKKMVSEEINKSTLLVGGTYPLISKYIGLELSEEVKSSLYVYSKEKILEIAKLWLEYFRKIGKPFVEKMTTEPDFALNLVLEYKHYFFPYCCYYLLILCQQMNMDMEYVKNLCDNLENQFDDFKKRANNFTEEYHKHWIEKYYRLKESMC